MRILVINLTRFGDLLQTQPVVAGLAVQGHEVGLVCLENFAGATALLPGLHTVFSLPGHRLLSGLDADWRQGLDRLRLWCEGPAAFQAQRVVNLTATLPARLLARLLAVPGETPVGFNLDEFGFGGNSSPWASFLVAATSRRGCSPFNLVDEFCEVAGTPRPGRRFTLAVSDPGAVDAAQALLAETAIADARGLLALQLGASAEARRWPVARFAALADALWERRGLCPVLLGTESERPLGERFRAVCKAPAADLMGRTGLRELAAVLERCELLVTNDTGTMHLAAGLGRPVCAMFLATAQPWDTGPYLAGSLSLEPDLPCHPCEFSGRCPHGRACRTHIPMEEVLDYVERRLDTGAWGLHAAPDPALARAWEARHDHDHFMDLVSLSGHENSGHTRWVRMQRWFYRQFLDLESPRPWPADEPLPDGETLAEARKVLGAAQAQLTLLVQQAKVLAMAPRDSVKAKFMGNWQRLQALWAGSPAFNVLGLLWAEQSQQAAGDLDGMTALAGRYLDLVTAWCDSLRSQNGTQIV